MDPSQHYGHGLGNGAPLPVPIYPNPHHHLNLSHHQSQNPNHHINPSHLQNNQGQQQQQHQQQQQQQHQNPNIHQQNPNSAIHQNPNHHPLNLNPHQNTNPHIHQNMSHHPNPNQPSHHQSQIQNSNIHQNLDLRQNHLSSPHQNLVDLRQNSAANQQNQNQIPSPLQQPQNQIPSPHLQHQQQQQQQQQHQLPSPHHQQTQNQNQLPTSPRPPNQNNQISSPHQNLDLRQNSIQNNQMPTSPLQQTQQQNQVPSPRMSSGSGTGSGGVQSPEEQQQQQQPSSNPNPPKEGKANNTFIAIIDRLCMETRYAARFGVKLMAMGILEREKLDDIMEEKDEKIRARRIYHEAMKMSIPWDKLFQALLNSGNVNVIDFIKQDIFLGLLFDAPKHDTTPYAGPSSATTTTASATTSASSSGIGPPQYPLDFYSQQTNSYGGSGSSASASTGLGSSNYERSSVIYKNPSGYSGQGSQGHDGHHMSFHQSLGLVPKGQQGANVHDNKNQKQSAKRKTTQSKNTSKKSRNTSTTPRAKKNTNNSADPADPNSTANNTSTTTTNASGKIKRRRRRKATPEEWLRVKNKMLRMTGQEYMGYTKIIKTPDGQPQIPALGADGQPIENAKMTVRKKRELGPRCDAAKCVNIRGKKGTQCRNFNEEDRLKIFQRFWMTMDWEQRKVYVSSLVDVLPKKTSTVKGRLAIRRRDLSFVYMLKLNGEKQRVCKKMFLSTLGIGPGAVSSWVLKSVENAIPRPPKGDFQEFIKEKKKRDSGPKIPKKKGRPRKEKPPAPPKIDRRRKKQQVVIKQDSPDEDEMGSAEEGGSQHSYNANIITHSPNPNIKVDHHGHEDLEGGSPEGGDGYSTPMGAHTPEGDDGEDDSTPQGGDTPMGPHTPLGPSTPPESYSDEDEDSLEEDEDDMERDPSFRI